MKIEKKEMTLGCISDLFHLGISQYETQKHIPHYEKQYKFYTRG